MFSNKPNLKNTFKSAGEEIDKVLNIWILPIHKEYISTCTEWQGGKKSDLHAKSIVLYLRFSDDGKPPWISSSTKAGRHFDNLTHAQKVHAGKISLPVGVVVPFRRRCWRSLLTTTRAHFYPPFCFSQNSTAVASYFPSFLGPALSPPPDQLVTCPKHTAFRRP